MRPKEGEKLPTPTQYSAWVFAVRSNVCSASGRPADVIGLHFFAPANIMKLLEIVRAPTSSLAAAATEAPASPFVPRQATTAAALALLALGLALTRPDTSRRTRRSSPGS